MKFSLWILKDFLGEQAGEIDSPSQRCEIADFRLYDPKVPERSDTMYIGSARRVLGIDDDRIACRFRKEFLLINTCDLIEASNRILAMHRFYYEWEMRCQDVINHGRSLQELLDLAEEMLKTPLMLIDNSQFLISHSRGLAALSGYAGVRAMMEEKSFPEEILRIFNRDYQETFFATESFFLPKGLFPTASWCHNIFIDERPVANLILAVNSDTPSPGVKQRFEQIVPLIQRWIEVNHGEDSANDFNSSLARLLDGNMDSLDTACRRLSLRGWHRDCRKILITAAAVSEEFHFDAYLAHSISLRHPGIYGIQFQKSIIFLCNLDMMEEEALLSLLEQKIREHLYYGASSVIFTDLEDLREAFFQASHILTACTPVTGHIYTFRENAMHYITDLAANASALSTLHPLPEMIAQYDHIHRSGLYETLFSYLRNERSQQLTSRELYIHRNTLTLRLARIEELWHPDLENAAERFYLLYSFYAREYRKE